MAPTLELDFLVLLPRQGPHPTEQRRLRCAPRHELLRPLALAAHQEALAARQVDPTSLVLRFRDKASDRVLAPFWEEK